MKQKFVWNLLLVVLLNLLIKPFYILGVDAEVINRVGASVYGNYFALINFSFLLNIILDLGITNYNVKNIAQHHHLVEKHFSGIITLRFILVFIYLLLTLFIAVFIGYNMMQLKLLFILSINQALVAFILYMRSNLAGLHLFIQDSFVSVLDRVLLIIICSLLLWGGVTSRPFQIEWFVYTQTIAYIITLIFCAALLINKTKTFNIKWSLPFALVILKRSFPYAVLILLMSIYYRIDSVMLERMLDDQSIQAGIYAQAYRFFEASNMIAYLFAALLLPILSRMLKMNDSITEIIKCSFKMLMFCACSISIFSYIYSYEIMSFRYNQYLSESSDIFIILMTCFLFVSSTYIFGTLLTANGNLLQLNIIASLGLIINVVLNIILIPKYMAWGSAIASLVTQSLTGCAQFVLCCYVFNLNLRLTLFRTLIFSLGVLIFGYYSQFFIDSPLLIIISYSFVCLIWGFVTKMLSFSDFNLLMDKKMR